MSRIEIYVYAGWKQVEQPTLMGKLYAETTRGNEVFSFEYDNDWLQSRHAMVIDPDLQLMDAPQYLPDQGDNAKETFGVFTDSSPDKWGRLLMRRREAVLARIEKRRENRFQTSDYLLGVHDQQRIGGLRYKLEPDGAFLKNEERFPAPPMARLRELEQISLNLENKDAADDPEYLEWLNQLIAPGASLGGARPKAGVTDLQNHLWIAKFPSTSDLFNAGGWEMATRNMAIEAGIIVPEARIEQFNSDHHTFLIRRFDRIDSKRIHFLSAMTVLGEKDFHQDASYLHLAEWIIANGSSPDEDLEQLFRRVCFNVCVSNVDDHLRNHGFLLDDNGWRLSPAYDINPDSQGRGLRLNISETSNALDLDLCLKVSGYFRVSKGQGVKIIEQIKKATSNFKEEALKLGINKTDIDLVAGAFGNWKNN